MSRYAQTIRRLEQSAQDSALRRTIAARFDHALRMAGANSARATTWLTVSEGEVQYWRSGITVLPMQAFSRLAAKLGGDVDWVCTGLSPAHLAP
jgi:hypothetical protein